MAKSKKNMMGGMIGMPDPGPDDFQTREDVNTLMRADEVHADSKRHKRAMSRMNSTLQRFSKKPGRSGGR